MIRRIWDWCSKNTQMKFLCWWHAEAFQRNWWNSRFNLMDKKYLQNWRFRFDKVSKQQDWSYEINSRGTLQKKSEKYKRNCWSSGMEHQSRWYLLKNKTTWNSPWARNNLKRPPTSKKQTENMYNSRSDLKWPNN